MQFRSSSVSEDPYAISGRRRYASMPAMRTSSVAAPGPAALDRTRYRDPHLQKALAEDPRRILIVADLGTSTQIAVLLHTIGRFETRTARSADVALNIARRFLPSVVLMSTDLPHLDSDRLAASLRWNSSSPAPRLIALTDGVPGSGCDDRVETVFERYLSLPVQSAALESALVPCSGRQGGRDFRDARRLRGRN